MNEEQRCPICGLRPGTHIGTQTIQNSWETMTIRYYSGSSTEPFCFGHQEAQSTNALKDWQRLCKRQMTQGASVLSDGLLSKMHAGQVEVPQVFQDAFRDEELEL